MVTKYRIANPMKAVMKPHRARIWNVPRVGAASSRAAMARARSRVRQGTDKQPANPAFVKVAQSKQLSSTADTR